jgi:predicted DNA-binding transcriptional regulator AlpA
MARRKTIRFLSDAQLHERGITYSAPHRRRLIAEGKFPAPVKLNDGNGNATTVFVETEIEAWQAARIAQRDAKRAAAAEAIENHA